MHCPSLCTSWTCTTKESKFLDTVAIIPVTSCSSWASHVHTVLAALVVVRVATSPVGEAPGGPVSPAPVPPGAHTLPSNPDWLRWHEGLSPLIQEGIQALRVYGDHIELVLKSIKSSLECIQNTKCYINCICLCHTA